MTSENLRDMPFVLQAEGLSVKLGGRKVLEVPTLQVYASEVLMVMGPNGAGKSTLLLCLALLLRPASGTVLYGGVPVLGEKQILQLRRRLAVVFQDPLLLNSSVWDNVTVGLRLRGMKGPQVRALAEKWLDRFGIADLAKRQARLLSGGEARRVSLARAFALEPDVLFLDEPFNALDSPTRQALLDDFESVLRETRVTTVMVTHDRNEALALAHRIAVLIDGSIRQVGTSREVFASPVDESVASFVGVENIIQGTVARNADGMADIRAGDQLIQVVSGCPDGREVDVCIRPEDVTLSMAQTSTSARNCFAGKITRVVSFGVLSRVELDCGFPLVALVTVKSAEEMGMEKGARLFASFKATAIHVIER